MMENELTPMRKILFGTRCGLPTSCEVVGCERVCRTKCAARGKIKGIKSGLLLNVTTKGKA